MGKLTEEVFSESCCEAGGEPGEQSARVCGCDPGLKPKPWVCAVHQAEANARAAIEELDQAYTDLLNRVGKR